MKRKTLLTLVLAMISPAAVAHDLVLQDASILKVSPCDRQIRLTVRHDAAGHKHLTDKQTSGPYRIGVYSTKRKKLIYSQDVEDQDAGETLFFVVPSGRLACDTKVSIRVDDTNKVKETNEDNNQRTQSWVLNDPKSPIQTCVIDEVLCK